MQFENALAPISLTVLGIDISSIPQPQNALLSIESTFSEIAYVLTPGKPVLPAMHVMTSSDSLKTLTTLWQLSKASGAISGFPCIIISVIGVDANALV